MDKQPTHSCPFLFPSYQELYRVHLMRNIEKTEKEMVNLDRKIWSLIALPSWTSARWMGWSSSGSFICRAGCCSPLIVAILWRTTQATMMSHALSGVTLSLHRHWNRDLSMPMAISTWALVLQWPTLKCFWGPGSGTG